MSEALRPAGANELGVVDPIRIPGWDRWARTPGLARLFIGLAVIDIAVRLIGVIGPPFYLNLDQPLAVISGFVPRSLWIALPGIILIRRQDAARSIRWIFRGAVVLALGTLAVKPLTGLLATYVEPYPAVIAVLALHAILVTVAWLMLGRGFEALRHRPAAPVGRALAILVAGGLILGAVINLIAVVSNSGADFEIEGFVLNLLAALGGLATAYALWAVVRGLGDPQRPRPATRLGVAAATTWAVATALSALSSAWYLLNRPWPDYTPLLEFQLLTGWLAVAVAPVMLVAAIAIGLVDPDTADRSELPIG